MLVVAIAKEAQGLCLKKKHKAALLRLLACCCPCKRSTSLNGEEGVPELRKQEGEAVLVLRTSLPGLVLFIAKEAQGFAEEGAFLFQSSLPLKAQQ